MKYNINNNNLNKIFFSIVKKLEECDKIIEELLEIDYKYSKTKVKLKLKQLKEIIRMLEDEKLEIKTEQKILIHYNGNPLITLNLCVLALLSKTTIILEFNKSMLAVNSLIINIVNEVLMNYQTDRLIYLKDKNYIDHEKVDKIICIDDIHTYNKYKRNKNTNVKFYSFKYIDFYSDSNELEDLTELIFKYAEDNNIPIESYSELDVKEAINLMSMGFGASIVLLTNNEEIKRLFKNNIKNKNLYINENPFKQETKIIRKEIFDI